MQPNRVQEPLPPPMVFNVVAFILLLASTYPANYARSLLAMAGKAVPYNFKPWVSAFETLPVGGLLFGICFGLVARFVLRHKAKPPGANEIIAMIMLFPLIEHLVPMVVNYAAVYLNYMGIPVAPLAYFVLALLFGVVTAGSLFVQMGASVVLMTGVIGGVVVLIPLVIKVPFNLPGYWYSFVGGFMAISISRDTY